MALSKTGRHPLTRRRHTPAFGQRQWARHDRRCALRVAEMPVLDLSVGLSTCASSALFKLLGDVSINESAR